MDLHITVPANLIVASNGRLLSVAESTRPDGNVRTYNWHVSTPIANYSVALNIAPYETLSETYQSVSGDPIAVTYWVLPENVEKGKELLQEILRHMRVFEELLGPYPFRIDKYGVAETPHLGMEHQTIIAYGHGYQGGRYTDHDYDWLHNHEFAHEWWANLVTCADWKDFWIHEGIGTYMQALYLERRFGPEAYHEKMKVDRRGIINRGPVAPRVVRSTQQMYFSQDGPTAPGIDVYMKGAWFCHTLRWYLGDETFFRVLRRWAYPDPELEQVKDGGQVRFSSTEEIRAIAEEHAGRELGWLFEVYLRQPALPRLVAEQDGDVLNLRWEVPDELPFPLPVPVQVGDDVVRVEMPHGRGSVALGGRAFVVDPQHWLLKVEE
jgi:aminopeptidase N